MVAREEDISWGTALSKLCSTDWWVFSELHISGRQLTRTSSIYTDRIRRKLHVVLRGSFTITNDKRHGDWEADTVAAVAMVLITNRSVVMSSIQNQKTKANHSSSSGNNFWQPRLPTNWSHYSRRKDTMSASTKLPKYFDQVPQSARVWTALALTANVYNSSVYDFTAFKSASKMAQKQFLLLRTVMTTQERLNPEQFGFQEKCEQAMRIIDSSDDFQGYLKDTEEGKNERRNIFYLLKKQQLEVLGQALSKKVGMRFHDEVIVNSTFMTLLVGISDLSKNCEFAWISSRVTLAADFSRGEEAKEDRKYSAITDGQLQHLSTHGIKVLVECKRYSRSKCPYKVDMQEAAQMVAWIKEHPGPERQ